VSKKLFPSASLNFIWRSRNCVPSPNTRNEVNLTHFHCIFSMSIWSETVCICGVYKMKLCGFTMTRKKLSVFTEYMTQNCVDSPTTGKKRWIPIPWTRNQKYFEGLSGAQKDLFGKTSSDQIISCKGSFKRPLKAMRVSIDKYVMHAIIVQLCLTVPLTVL
jgi:hypothetical protein